MLRKVVSPPDNSHPSELYPHLLLEEREALHLTNSISRHALLSKYNPRLKQRQAHAAGEQRDTRCAAWGYRFCRGPRNHKHTRSAIDRQLYRTKEVSFSVWKL